MSSLLQKGKPHIFLLDDPEREKRLPASYVRDQQALVEYAPIVDCLYRIVGGKQYLTDDRQVLKTAFRSRFKVVYAEAGRRLVQLSHYFPEAGDDLRELLGDKSSQIRLRVVQSLWSDLPPDDLTDYILAVGLADRSKVVQEFAADRKEMIEERRGKAWG